MESGKELEPASDPGTSRRISPFFFWKVPVFENRVYGIHGYYSFLCVFKVSFFGFIGYDRCKLTILPISLRYFKRDTLIECVFFIEEHHENSMDLGLHVSDSRT